MTKPHRWTLRKRRLVARLVATASSLLFLVSLLVMARWILRREGPEGMRQPLPSAYDSLVPLIAMTVASAAFPVASLSVVFLVQTPDSLPPEDEAGPPE